MMHLEIERASRKSTTFHPIILADAPCRCPCLHAVEHHHDDQYTCRIHHLEDTPGIHRCRLDAHTPLVYPDDHSLRASINHTQSGNHYRLSSPRLVARLRPVHLQTRSLTDPPLQIHDEMTTCVPAPESPPELASSKSSKSSSFRSSSLSGADGALSDLAHFVDIGLSDEHPTSSRDLYGHSKSTIHVSSLRRASSIMSGNKSPASGAIGMRELTNGVNKPQYPPLQGQLRHASVYGAALSLNLPNSHGPKGGVRSPSSPSVARAALRNGSQSRSPSPKNLQAIPASPRPTTNPTPGLRPSSSLFVRRSSSQRGSWQPSRKTAKELEDEYHDSDEDLPDDASLWNVPLSPSLYRTASNAASVNASPGTSPERPSRLSASIGRDATGLRPIQTAPAGGQPFCGTPDSIAPSPGIPRGSSAGIMPDSFNFSKTRAKSWTAALFELSEEAQSLSEALEAHAAEADSKQEEKAQRGVSSVKPSMDKLTRPQMSVVELPPLRKNDVMIDPLPISKEKEKVLSRTRPSWLPPKNQKEERKHLKEYQRMMEMSMEAGTYQAHFALSR